MDLRISSGKFRNTKLKVADETRPVKERVKLAVFSKISDKLANSECLDLYAGTGNLGLESISRGAKSVDLIEINSFAVKAIEQNILTLKQNFREEFDSENIRVFKKDALDYISNEVAHYDIVFADPPYSIGTNHLLKMVDNVMKPDALFVFFRDSTQTYNIEGLNPKLKLLDSRKYGLTTVDFIAQV